jgi:hypothetical protein
MSSPFPPSQGPGYFSDNPFQSPEMTAATMMPRRGMVNQVRVVAILNIVQGVLELLMGGMLVLVGGMFVAMREEMLRDAVQRGEANPELMVNIMTGAMLAIGGVPLLTGILRIVAGIRNLVFRSRVLAMISLFAGLLTAFTGYCAITSIGIAVYGLIVLFNREVAEAFEMRKNGATADDVLRTFNSRPY